MKNDKNTTLQELKDKMAHFVAEREWNQFHNAKDLSMALAVEAAELMEKFQWVSQKDAGNVCIVDKQEVGEELADVLALVFAFANAQDIDLTAIYKDKMQKNGKKYPVELSKGSYTKYTKLKNK